MGRNDRDPVHANGTGPHWKTEMKMGKHNRTTSGQQTLRAPRGAGGSPQPSSEWVDITPAMAREWLKKNTNNRPPLMRLVRRLASDFASGNCVLTHQGIGFDTDGFLIDGQHRLMAIVESGVTVKMLVTRNLPPQSRAVIDTGTSRRLPQVLAMAYGTKNATAMVAWINAIELLTTGDWTVLSVSEAHERMDAYQAGLEWATTVFLGRVGKRISAPVIGALVYAHRAMPEAVGTFGSSLVTGADLRPGSPVLALRNYVIANPSVSGSLRRLLMLRTLRALFKHADGESLVNIHPTEADVDRLKKIYEAK